MACNTLPLHGAGVNLSKAVDKMPTPRTLTDTPWTDRSSKASTQQDSASAGARFLRLQVAHDVNEQIERTLQMHMEELVRSSHRQVLMLESMIDRQNEADRQMGELCNKMQSNDKAVSDLDQSLSEFSRKILAAVNALGKHEQDLEGEVEMGFRATQEKEIRRPKSMKDVATCVYDFAGADANHEHSVADLALAKKRAGTIKRIVTSSYFEFLCAFIIGLNAVHIALSTELAMDYAINNVGQGSWVPSEFISMSGLFFNVFYLIELVMKLLVFRLKFFTGEDSGWNIFDFALVCSGVLNLIMDEMLSGASIDLKWLRLLRLLKMMKMLRVVRVMHMFTELRLMVSAIKSSGGTLLWLIVLLGITFFIFGMCFLQGLTAFLNEATSDSMSEEQFKDIQDNWSTVDVTMLTLFASITGGRPWMATVEPLALAGSLYHSLFLLYMAFSLFAISNVVTGIFVDACLKLATSDYDSLVQEVIERDKLNSNRLKEIFLGMDENGDGTFTYSELCDKLGDPKVRAFFTAFQVEADDAKRVYKMIDRGHDHGVSVDDFLHGCIKLKGTAKSIDMFCLMKETTDQLEHMNHFMNFAEESFDGMRSAFRKMGFKQPEVLPLSERLLLGANSK